MNNEEILGLIYGKLQNEVVRTLAGNKKETIFQYILHAKSNKVFEVFVKSSVEATNIPKDSLTWLLQRGYITLLLNNELQAKVYVLTSQGIWAYEESIGKINTQKLLEIIQMERFDFSVSTDPLSEKEIVALLSMISLRAFSRKTAMDLTKSQKCDYWLKVFTQVDKLCVELKLSRKSVFENKKFGLENPASYLMRRMNDLSKKTNNIYYSPGEKVYFLNIGQADQLAGDKLVFLWKKIFPKGFSFELKSTLIDKLNLIAQENSVFICDDFETFTPEWDAAIANIKFTILS